MAMPLPDGYPTTQTEQRLEHIESLLQSTNALLLQVLEKFDHPRA